MSAWPGDNSRLNDTRSCQLTHVSCMRCKHSRTVGVSMAKQRRGTAPRMSFDDQDQATHRIVHTDELSARDRAIGSSSHSHPGGR